MLKMKALIDKQRRFFYTGETKSYDFRKQQLIKFREMLKKYESAMYKTLEQDLGKSKHESFVTEIGLLYGEISFLLKELKGWMQKEKVATPLTHKGTTGYILKDPYGVVLVISPWNYPIQLTLLPVISAIGAGNTVVIKPSEIAPYTSSLIHKMISETYGAEFITVVEGDKETSDALLAERFDYIFFTGSTQIGKIIMKKASKHLTPVTLELGGKSPAIVDKSANISLSAKRIVWGKFTNAGQTCVAPDYLYVNEAVYPEFMKAVGKEIRNLYSKTPLKNKKYGKIINRRHFERLTHLMHHGKITYGGEIDEAALKIAPTVIEGITWEDPIMQEEIFGPLLPVMKYDNLDNVIETIQSHEKPLALYYFGKENEQMDHVIEHISFGGGCVNDCLYHLANPHLPFGGVGQSGMGAYHGKYGFDTFTHNKSVMHQTTKFDLPIRYPGGKVAHKLVKQVMK